MLLARRGTVRALIAAGAFLVVSFAHAQIDVVSERYDDARTGANLAETTLNTSNVNVDSFGKLWSYTVSGSVYAQPLYVRNVDIAGGTHNVLYVVTMNDIVYAFDADSGDRHAAAFTGHHHASRGFDAGARARHPRLRRQHHRQRRHREHAGDRSRDELDVFRRAHARNGRRLRRRESHLLPAPAPFDIRTLEEIGTPVLIGGSVPGNGSGSSAGTLTFDPKWHDQRSSLALSNGRVFIAWSSHSDQGPYHGWVMAYDAATLTQTMIWSAAPDGGSFNGGGVWMAGRAPSIDADGNVYYITGNGTWDGTTNFGESIVKFGATPDAPLLDWFTPDNVNDPQQSRSRSQRLGPDHPARHRSHRRRRQEGVLYLTNITISGIARRTT